MLHFASRPSLMLALALSSCVLFGAGGAATPAAAQGLRFDFNMGWDDPPPPPGGWRRATQPLPPLMAPRFDDDQGDEPDVEPYADLPSPANRWRQWRRLAGRPLPPLMLPRPGWQRRYDDADLAAIDPEDRADWERWNGYASAQRRLNQFDSQDEAQGLGAYSDPSAPTTPPLPQTYGGYPDNRSDLGRSGGDFGGNPGGGIEAEPLAPPVLAAPSPLTIHPPARIVTVPPASADRAGQPSIAKSANAKPQIAKAPITKAPIANPPKTASKPPVAQPPATTMADTKVIAPQPATPKPPAPKPQIVAKAEPAPLPVPKPLESQSSPPPLLSQPESPAKAQSAGKPQGQQKAPDTITRNGKACPRGSEIESRLVADGWSGFADPEKGEKAVMMTAKRDGATYRLTLDRCTGVVLSAKLLPGKQASN